MTRATVGEIFHRLYHYLLVVLSLLSVFVYILCVIILKRQIYRAKQLGGNIGNISRKLKNQATQALSLNAFIHFVTFCITSIRVYPLTYQMTRH